MPDTKQWYQKQLADPQWQRKRLEIFERDDFTCRQCKSKDKELHVHHIYYLPNYEVWEYPDECYITLCYSCHEFEEEFLKEFDPKQFLHRLRMAGYRAMDLYSLDSFLASNFLSPKELNYWMSMRVKFMELKNEGVDMDSVIKEIMIEKGWDFT